VDVPGTVGILEIQAGGRVTAEVINLG
jgi:hypothetical protein